MNDLYDVTPFDDPSGQKQYSVVSRPSRPESKLYTCSVCGAERAFEDHSDISGDRLAWAFELAGWGNYPVVVDGCLGRRILCRDHNTAEYIPW